MFVMCSSTKFDNLSFCTFSIIFPIVTYIFHYALILAIFSFVIPNLQIPDVSKAISIVLLPSI